MKATLVHNPSAGFKNLSKEEMVKALSEKGFQVSYVSSKEDNLEEALAHPGDLVVVAGGDGTIAKVANKLIARNIPIGVLPIGTANNIAATLKIKGFPLAQINTWNRSDGRAYDVGVAVVNEEETHFFESTGFGILTELMIESAKKQKAENISFKDRKAKTQFAIGIIKSILQKKAPAFYHILLDGKDFSGKYFMVEIMNIKSVGPNIALAPNADPGDGYFDIILIAAADKEHLLQYLDQLLLEKDAVFKIKSYRASHLYISSEEPKFHVDDEILDIDASTKIKIALKPDGLTFL